MLSDLIVVAEHRSSAPSVTHHLMSRLLLDRQVLWVDAKTFRRERPGPSVGAKGGTSGATSQAPAGCTARLAPFPVISAEDLGVGDHPLSRLVSPRLLHRRIRRAAEAQGLRRPMLWLASPWAAPILDDFPESPVVYQIPADDVLGQRDGAAHPSRGEALARHQRLLSRADLLLAPSRAAAASLPPERTWVLSAAVDLDLFANPVQKARDLPSPGPVAGCHGCLDADFDADLLAAVAGFRPDWQFLLLGPVARDMPALQALPNVHLAGVRAHDQLPRYLQHWQVSLLLRRPDLGAPPAPSLTLLESLASGVPIISSGAWNLGRFADMVIPVNGAREAALALSDCVYERPRQRPLGLHRLVAETWSARAAMVSHLLAELERGTPAVVRGRSAGLR